MKRTYLFLLIIIISNSILFGQEARRIEISEISIWQGLQTYNFEAFSNENFDNLFGESVLQPENISEYSSSAFFWGMPLQTTFFGANVGFKFFDENKKLFKSNPVLTVGITYGETNMFASHASNSEFVHTDTLVSISGAETWYKGVSTYYSYDRKYSFDQLGLNVGIIYRYNPDGRWALLGGFNLKTLFSFNSTVTETYSVNTHDTYEYEPNAYVSLGYSNYDNISSSETHKTRLNTTLIMSMPLGLDFRIGKKNLFWKRIHITVGAQPSFNMFYIPEIGTIVSGNLIINSGLRLEIL